MNLLLNDPKVPSFCHFIPVPEETWSAINWREQNVDQEIGYMIECEMRFPRSSTSTERMLLTHVLFGYYLENGVELLKIYEVRKFEFQRWIVHQQNRLGSKFKLIPDYAKLRDGWTGVMMMSTYLTGRI